MNGIWIWNGSVFTTEDDAMRAYFNDTSLDHTLRGKSKPRKFVEAESPKPREFYAREMVHLYSTGRKSHPHWEECSAYESGATLFREVTE